MNSKQPLITLHVIDDCRLRKSKSSKFSYQLIKKTLYLELKKKKNKYKKKAI